jgi:hypothetical protein
MNVPDKVQQKEIFCEDANTWTIAFFDSIAGISEYTMKEAIAVAESAVKKPSVITDEYVLGGYTTLWQE